MDNQHRKITGYRELSQTEIDLMNEGKALAEKVGAYVDKLTAVRNPVISGDPLIADQRWVSIGRTHLQEGFMALTRAVARPTSF